MAIDTNGTLWAWGRNQTGILGDGTTIDRHTPFKIMDNVKSVSMSQLYALAVKTDGSLWSWGERHPSQLGNGIYENNCSVPKQITGGDSQNQLSEPEKYVVVYESNSDWYTKDVMVEKDDTILAPSTPRKTGFSFAGWYKDSEFTTPWDFNNDTVSGATTLYAKWNPMPDDSIKKATPTKSKLYIRDELINIESYNIDGYNYFKLRDIAYALNTANQSFSVQWDGSTSSIYLQWSKRYTPVGGELTVNPNSAELMVSPSKSTIYYFGKRVYLAAYLIGENNYFRLRDIAALMDYEVIWDAETNAITLNPYQRYVAEQ